MSFSTCFQEMVGSPGLSTPTDFPAFLLTLALAHASMFVTLLFAMLSKGWIKGRCIRGIWLATPCTTWSRARHGPVGSSWGPLRTNSNLFRLPGLGFKDRQKIRQGNATTRITCEIIELALKFGIPCYLENPAGSMMWCVPPLKALCAQQQSQCFVTDFCQHGARWRKRPRVQDSHKLTMTCSGRGGICCRTGLYHFVLKGQDPVSKQTLDPALSTLPKRFRPGRGRCLEAFCRPL